MVGQVEFEDMPEPVSLRLVRHEGQVLVTHGRSLVYRFDADDLGMRNLAIVALTDAGRRVNEVAAVFGLTATYVSMLRGQARREGSAGLARRRGRPPRLTGRQIGQAREWAAKGWTQQSIADRLGVAQSVISELLARFRPASV
jgi:transposase